VKKFWLATKEQKQKALNKIWKIATADGVLDVRKAAIAQWKMEIWLEFEIQVTEDEIKEFILEKIT
jgi:hypothetical protein